MHRKPYDPLAMIPPPEAIRARLIQSVTLTERLRILLDLAERLHLPLIPASELPARSKAKGANPDA